MKFLGSAAMLGAITVAVPVDAHTEGKADAKAEFFARLTAMCGATFEGASVFPRDAGDAVTLAPDGKSMSYYLEREAKPRFKAELARTAN